MFFTDDEKANLFKQMLRETFSPDNTIGNNFNEEHYLSTNRNILSVIEKCKNNDKIKLFTLNELNKVIKELKNKSSHGNDEITNVMLKRSPDSFRIEMLKLFNQTIVQSKWLLIDF